MMSSTTFWLWPVLSAIHLKLQTWEEAKYIVDKYSQILCIFQYLCEIVEDSGRGGGVWGYMYSGHPLVTIEEEQASGQSMPMHHNEYDGLHTIRSWQPSNDPDCFACLLYPACVNSCTLAL